MYFRATYLTDISLQNMEWGEGVRNTANVPKNKNYSSLVLRSKIQCIFMDKIFQAVLFSSFPDWVIHMKCYEILLA